LQWGVAAKTAGAVKWKIGVGKHEDLRKKQPASWLGTMGAAEGGGINDGARREKGEDI